MQSNKVLEQKPGPVSRCRVLLLEWVTHGGAAQWVTQMWNINKRGHTRVEPQPNGTRAHTCRATAPRGRAWCVPMTTRPGRGLREDSHYPLALPWQPQAPRPRPHTLGSSLSQAAGRQLWAQCVTLTAADAFLWRSGDFWPSLGQTVETAGRAGQMAA